MTTQGVIVGRSSTTISISSWSTDQKTDEGSTHSQQSEATHSLQQTLMPSFSRTGYSDLPQVVDFTRSNDKEVFFADEKQVAGAGEKQVIEDIQLPEALDEEGGKEVVQSSIIPVVRERSTGQFVLLDRILWDRRTKFSLAAILLLALLAIGLSVGLGLGLHSAPKSTPFPEASYQAIGGSLNAAYYSSEGAFNGTGMALAAQSLMNESTLVLYFQHWTGQIRFMQLGDDGHWVGGNAASVVTTDAKNNTPISLVSYVIKNGTEYSSQWHVYYIDQQNRIRERYNTNNTYIWQDGVINGMQVTAMDSEQAGLLACWLGDNTGIDLGANDTTENVGVRLWYASNSTTFQQLGWHHDYNAWEYEQSLPNLNGYTSPACYSWGPGTTTYTMFTNLYGSVNVYWQDTAWNKLSTTNHPINQWANSSISIPGHGQAAQLAYTNALYGQTEEDHLVRGYNISWAAENSTVISGSEFLVDNDPGLPGTRLMATELPAEDGSDALFVFFQTNGSDITQFWRDVDGNTWKKSTLPIPQE